jgi:hypothetical protein
MFEEEFAPLTAEANKKEVIKPHDIYKYTQTMPNKELRLLHVQVNGSLLF